MTAIEVYKWKGVPYGYAATPAELDAVLALYDDYDTILGVANDALKGPALTQAFRDAIHDGYDFTQYRRKLQSIRYALLDGVEHCPSCGIAPPRELDHYLPRSAFNPLAVYVRNLIPFCHDCNQSKTATVAANPAERFVHAYLEPLPAIRFLRATVTLDHAALNTIFDIDPAAALPALTRARLQHQITRLKLNERYAREINTYLSGYAVAFHDAYAAAGAAGVRSFFLRQAHNDFQRFHLNHWRPVLLSALANHAAFCDGGFAAVFPLLNPLLAPV